MATVRSHRSNAVLGIGIAAGYGAWIAVTALLAWFTPLRETAAAALFALVVLVATACYVAKRQSDRDIAIAWWSVPTLPALTSAYFLLGPFLLAIGANISP